MNKQWVLNTTLLIYGISILLFFIFHNGLKYKSKNNLGNYQNIISINKKTKSNASYDNNVIDNKPSSIFYFIHISDIHISEIFTNGSFSHFKCFVENILPTISPNFVFVTGDITDAAAVNGKQSKQKEREWNAYKTILDKSEIIQNNRTLWFDMRGNHDAFNTPSFEHEANLYKKYSRTKASTFHINYETDYGSYTFNNIDATPLHGPSPPYNLFGTVDKERMDKIASIYDFAKANNHKHVFTFSHYPYTTINFGKTSDGRSWNDLSKQTSLYLSGHLHDLFLNLSLYTQHNSFVELEIKDFKIHGVYRIVAVDHDTISFIDNVLPMPEIPHQNKKTLEELLEQPKYNFTLTKPLVLITNPQDTQNVLSKNHYPKIEEKKLTHVRTLIFSEEKIASIELYIDGKKISTIDSLSNENSSFKLIGNDDKDAEDYLPLYAMKWDGNESYKDGKIHLMTIKAYDINNVIGENTIHFSFDNKRENYRISLFSRNALRFHLPTLLPLACAGLVFLYDFVLAVIPFLYVHNSNYKDYADSTYRQMDENEQYELEHLNENDFSISSDNEEAELTYKNTKNSVKKEKKSFLNRFFIQPFLSFSANPLLFYPYHFFNLYNLIGPQIFGSLMPAGDSYKERFVVAFLHGVIANGQRVNYLDGYFYLFKDLLKVQLILFLQMVYLNHCKCRQFYISIIIHILLIFYCIKTHYRAYLSYGILRILSSPFYSWFMIWEIIAIVTLIIHNLKTYSLDNKKIF